MTRSATGPVPAPLAEAPAAAPAAPAGWIVLCKPRLNSLVVATAIGGAWLGSAGRADGALLLHAAGGTALTAAGASALNMVLERRTDALMERTRDRPVPAGRIAPGAAALFGALLGAAGILWLALATTPAAAALAAGTLLVYLAVYTPLKGRSTVNTLVGAIPGALPPIIGWAASGAPLDARAGLLFGVLFLWQIPHFLAIAWIYREDYRRAGLVMITRLDDDGASAGRHAFRYAVATGLLSLAAPATGLAWEGYLAGAAVAGALYAAAAAAFALRRTDARARLLLRASLLYVPAFYALLVLHVR